MHERRGADGLRRWRKRGDAQGTHLRGRARRNRNRRWSPTSGIRSAPAASTWSSSAPRRPARSRIRYVRQEIAKLMIMAKSAEWTARRARAAQEQGRPQGPEGSLGKLAASNVARAGGPRAYADHRRRRDADRRRQPARGNHRRDPGLGARRLDRRRHRRDPAQHHRRTRTAMPKEPRFDTGPFRNVKRN